MSIIYQNYGMSRLPQMFWRPKAMHSVKQPTKGELLSRVAEILEEVGRSGPYTVAPEWFTLDLSMPQVRPLFLLLEDPLRMNQLVSTLGVSSSRATALVDGLVDKGRVTR